MAKVGGVFVDFEARTVKFEQGVNRAKGKLRDFGGEATRGRARIRGLDQALSAAGVRFLSLTGAIGSVALGLRGMVREGLSFEVGMNKVAAVSGATGEQFERLRLMALAMGRDTRYTAAQAADGLSFLAMAGFDADAAIAALPHTLDLATAGQLELGRAADIASNIMGQFGIKATETQRVTDVLARTASRSNTNIEQLSEAFKYLGPTAEAIGISLEEASAAVGILGDAGLQGSMATRALGTALTALASPETAGKLRRLLDVDAFDARGQFIGLAELIDRMNATLKDMTAEQQQAALSQIFGAEPLQEFNILLARGSDYMRQFTKQLEDSAGAGKEMAAKMDAGATGAFQRLQSAISSVSIAVFEDFKPAMQAAADVAARFFSSLTASRAPEEILADLDRLRAAFQEGLPGVDPLSVQEGPYAAMAQEILTLERELRTMLLQPGSVDAVAIAVARVKAELKEASGPNAERLGRILEQLKAHFADLSDVAAAAAKPVQAQGEAMEGAAKSAERLAGPLARLAETNETMLQSFKATSVALREFTVSAGATDAALGDVFEQASAQAAERHEEGVKRAKEQRELLEEAEVARRRFQQGFIEDAVDGIAIGEKFSDVLRSIGQDLARMAMRNLILGSKGQDGVYAGGLLTGALGGLFGGGGGGAKGEGAAAGGGWGQALGAVFSGIFGGARANGGGVSAGKGYLVGERGPEWFAPGQSGSVVPNHALGGVTNTFNINIDASGADPASIDRLVRELPRMIDSRVVPVVAAAQRRRVL